MLSSLVNGVAEDHPGWEGLEEADKEKLHEIVAENSAKSKLGSSARRKQRRKALSANRDQ